MNEFDFVIEDSASKMHEVFSNYKISEIAVSYSGGADSDIMAHFIKSNGYDLKYVFFDTGIEYRATLKHVEEMKNKDFDIDTIKPKIPIPTSNIKYGQPFISKNVSDMLQRLQKHQFDFKNHGNYSFEMLWEMYPNAKSALRWWTNTHKIGSKNISNNRYLKEFLMENGLPFKVSPKCCDGAKKRPIKDYSKKNGIILNVVGLRRSEGGVRASFYKNCYYKSSDGKIQMYFPLFWWTNDIKEYYKNKYNITYSDCYEVYGLDRTGCAGCPFGRKFDEELSLLEKYEPKLNKGIQSIFQKSYNWSRKYREFALEMKEKNK